MSRYCPAKLIVGEDCSIRLRYSPKQRREADGSTQLTLGPPRYYAPVCVLYWHGFSGGPTAYREVDAGHDGPIVLAHRGDCRYEEPNSEPSILPEMSDCPDGDPRPGAQVAAGA